MQETIRIIQIDPDHAAQQAFAGYAAEAGLPYTIEAVPGVEAARQRLVQAPGDLVISELSLEDGDVFDILAEEPQPLVIVLTGAGSEQTAVDALQAGAADYIFKDPRMEHLQRIPPAVERAMQSKARQSQFKTLTHAIMSTYDSVFITDMQDTIIFVNKAFCSTYGYSEDDVLGRHVSSIWKDRPADSTPGPGRGWHADVFNLRRDGSSFPVSLSRSVVYDDSGDAFAVVGVARDITERMQAEEKLKASLNEKEVLLREIHHRVKNNLQIISSLLNLQAGFSGNAQTSEALRDSQNRVKSMALIHERLYQSKTLTEIDFPVYIRSLVEHLRSSFRDAGNLSIDIQGEDLQVEVDVAVPCGLILNELLTNAIKHAFPERSAGSIRIILASETPDEAHLAGRMLMQVRDNGLGFPEGLDPRSVQTLGLQLITMLVQQLKGEVTFDQEDGVACSVRVPLSQAGS